MPNQQVNSTIPTSVSGSPLTNEKSSKPKVNPEIPTEKPKSTVPAASVQSSASDSLSTPQSGIPVSSTPESKKQSSISVTLISGETINPEIPAENPKSTVLTTSVQPPVSDSLSASKSDIPVSVASESNKQSSISVIFVSGETITKQTQPSTIDDHFDQTANSQQSVESSDSPISPETDNKVNPEISVEKPKSTVTVASVQSLVSDNLSTPKSDIPVNSIPEIKKQDSISVTFYFRGNHY